MPFVERLEHDMSIMDKIRHWLGMDEQEEERPALSPETQKRLDSADRLLNVTRPALAQYRKELEGRVEGVQSARRVMSRKHQ